jgi:hypothetical protein
LYNECILSALLAFAENLGMSHMTLGVEEEIDVTNFLLQRWRPCADI